MLKVHYIDSVSGETHILNKFLSHNLLEEINILSSDLPMNSFECDVITDITFSEGAALEVYSNDVYYGTFYISSVERISKVAYRLECYNSVFVLDKTEFDYWVAFSTLLLEREDNGLGGIDTSGIIDILKISSGINISSNIDLSPYSVFGHIPKKTVRFILCAIAFACGFMIDSSRSNGVALREIPQKISSTISADRIIGNSTVQKNSIITDSTLQQYSEVGNPEETTIRTKVEAGQKTHLIFDKPTDILSAYITTTDDNGNEKEIETTVIDGYINPEYFFCLNYYEFSLEDTDITEIGFHAFQYDILLEEKKIVNEQAPTSAKSNTVSFDDFLLLGEYEDSDGVFQKIDKTNDIKKYISSQRTVSAKIVLDGEKVGDLVSIETAWDGVITGIITSMNISFGYNDTADIEVLEWSL